MLIDLADYGNPRAVKVLGVKDQHQILSAQNFLLEASPGIDSPVAHVIGDDLHPVILPNTNTPIRKERGERPETFCYEAVSGAHE